MSYWQKYLHRAQKTAKFLRFDPFVKVVLLNGSIVRGEGSSESDIDFLIIAKAGRIYTARFFATILAGLAGHRRTGEKIAGRVCLNCYLSGKKLDISPHDTKSNLKVAKAYRYAIPLVDDGTSRKFFNENKWFGKYNVEGEKVSKFLKNKYFVDFPIKPKHIFEKFLSRQLGDWLERKLMEYQQARILKGKKIGDEIFADESEIRLHPKKGRGAG